MSLPVDVMDELELIHDINRQQHASIIPEAVHTVYMLLMMRENIAETCRVVNE
jgi:hypothetical protein